MRIGTLNLDNRYFLAPLAGISNLPFRLLNKEFGCALVYTEMISAEGLKRGGKNTQALLLSDERERPVSYQIFGHAPRSLAEAAAICEDMGADIVDINMGCPVKKVIRNGAGCALLDEPEKVRDILKSVRGAIRVPLTIKMRLGMVGDKKSYLDIAGIAESEGVDAICLHPRTKNQMFKGKIDLDALKKLKENINIPVIGSGDLFTVGDVNNMFRETNCDAVVIARGSMGNPFIFRDLLSRLSADPYTPLAAPDEISAKRTKPETKDAINKHIGYFLQYYSEDVCHREMKKHMVWYSKGFTGGTEFRRKVVATRGLNEMMELVEEFFTY